MCVCVCVCVCVVCAHIVCIFLMLHFELTKSTFCQKDDLASLNRGQEITIIGTMDIGSFTYILDAYIVENESE